MALRYKLTIYDDKTGVEKITLDGYSEEHVLELLGAWERCHAGLNQKRESDHAAFASLE